MKKLIFVAMMLPIFCFGQRDSSKMVFSNNQVLDTTLIYVTIALQVFSTPKGTETYWTGGWDKPTSTPVPQKNYGMDMKKAWDNLISLAKQYSIRNYKGEVVDINNEDKLFNLMAANGYRFLMKTPIQPMNIGIVAARAYGGTMYKFEKK